MSALKRQFKNGNAWLFISFLIMAVLFYSSSQTMSRQTQIPRLERWLSNQPLNIQLSEIRFYYANVEISIERLGYFHFIEFFIRKFAHFLSYFLLGVSLFNGLKNKYKRPIVLLAIISWLASTGYAGLDETHQMFTYSRSPLFEDVILNSVGAMTAIGLSLCNEGIKFLRKK